MVSYRIGECMLNIKGNKKQGYSLISISGDVLQVAPLDEATTDLRKSQFLRGFKKLSHLAQKQLRQQQFKQTLSM